jgi:methionyl-tRNA formyltransferase
MLCKKTLFCQYAACILKSYYPTDEILIVPGEVGSKLDDDLHMHKPRYIISFLSPWILPEPLLNSAQKAAINFHPGSPRYPGIGCYNFALYEKAEQYGVTCHHMKKEVDSGDIILTSYFNVSPNERVETLKLKSMNHLLYIFEKIVCDIYANDALPVSDEKWLCKPYTRKQLNDLCKIDPLTMNSDEIKLRVLAMDYGSRFDGAYIDIDGMRFFSQSHTDDPIA